MRVSFFEIMVPKLLIFVVISGCELHMSGGCFLKMFLLRVVVSNGNKETVYPKVSWSGWWWSLNHGCESILLSFSVIDMLLILSVVLIWYFAHSVVCCLMIFCETELVNLLMGFGGWKSCMYPLRRCWLVLSLFGVWMFFSNTVPIYGVSSVRSRSYESRHVREKWLPQKDMNKNQIN